jgi:tripeptidyl-peptidase-1
MYNLLPFAALLLSAVDASPVAHPKVLHEKREFIPAGWQKTHRVHEDVKLPMRIGLTQSNLDRGHDLLLDVFVLR